MEHQDYSETTNPSDIELYYSPTALKEDEELLKKKELNKQKKFTKEELRVKLKIFKEDFDAYFVKSKEVLK